MNAESGSTALIFNNIITFKIHSQVKYNLQNLLTIHPAVTSLSAHIRQVSPGSLVKAIGLHALENPILQGCRWYAELPRRQLGECVQTESVLLRGGWKAVAPS